MSKVSKKDILKDVIKRYMHQTGKKDAIDMLEVADFAISIGIVIPKPKSAREILARQLADVAREETRKDKTTGLPYRALHSYKQTIGCRQQQLWLDIDFAPRPKIHKSLIMRREQMVGDGYQLTLDAMHWNNCHPNDEPIIIPLDFTDDIEERLSLQTQNH